MKAITRILAVVVLSLWVWTFSSAGIPVIDPGQHAALLKQYLRLGAIVAELRLQVAALTGSRRVSHVGNQPADQESRRYASGSWKEVLNLTETRSAPRAVRALHAQTRALAKRYAIVGVEAYLHPAAPDAMAQERMRNTTLATLAIAEGSYDRTHRRLATLEDLIARIDQSSDLKASVDLQTRVTAEDGLGVAELTRLLAVLLQQQAARDTQHLVGQSTAQRMAVYDGFHAPDLSRRGPS